MAHAVDMLREHVPRETRIHYIVTNGGAAPNVVPDYAEGYFYARHPGMEVLDGIWDRIVSAVYNILPNDSLSALSTSNCNRWEA